MSNRLQSTYKKSTSSPSSSPSKIKNDLNLRQIKKLLFDYLALIEEYNLVIDDLELNDTLNNKLELLEIDEYSYKFISNKVATYESKLINYKYALNSLSKLIDKLVNINNQISSHFNNWYTLKGYNYVFLDKFSNNLSLIQLSESFFIAFS